MLKSKRLNRSTLIAVAVLSSQAASAGGTVPTDLPGPGIVGIVVAAVIGAIAISRSLK